MKKFIDEDDQYYYEESQRIFHAMETAQPVMVNALWNRLCENEAIRLNRKYWILLAHEKYGKPKEQKYP